MGARNVAAAYAMWPHLPHRAFRLLAGMAVTALDDAVDGRPARRYFASERSMAELLGPVPVDASRDASAFRSARAALRDLVDVGAVVRLTAGRRGSRAEFELILDPLAVAKGERHIPASAGTPRSRNAGTPHSQVGGTPRSHPGTTTGTTEESLSGEPGGRSEILVQTARANDSDGPDLDTYEHAKKRLARAHGRVGAMERVLAAMAAEEGLDPKDATIRLAADLDARSAA